MYLKFSSLPSIEIFHFKATIENPGTIMRIKLLLQFILALSIFSIFQRDVSAQIAKREIPVPNKAQLAWQQAAYGVIFHYDLHVFDSSKYAQTHNRITPIPDYNIFNPQELNVEQWVITAKESGAKFALLTATHETGFALYQSDVNPYSMKALKWKEGKGDIVKDFVDACRKHDIKPGIYLGIRWNSFLGVHNFVVDGEGEMQKARQKYYNAMVEGMVTEICTRYGPLFEIWFDGGADDPANGAPDVLPIVKKYQPDCLFYHNNQLAEARWGGSESGKVGYPCWSTFPFPFTGSGESAPKEISKNQFYLLKHGDSTGQYFVPAMADAPLRGSAGRHEWFWEPGDEKYIEPLNSLVEMYYQSVGRNATLILGLTPDNRGLMPAADVARMKEFGNEIKKRFDNPLGSTSGKGNRFEISFKKPVNVNQVVISENIALGHRVKNFKIRAMVNKKWKTIVTGSAIGNKFISLLSEPVLSDRFQLVIEDSFAVPEIIKFAVYVVPLDHSSK
jgi:alpha-L-fucosidase